MLLGLLGQIPRMETDTMGRRNCPVETCGSREGKAKKGYTPFRDNLYKEYRWYKTLQTMGITKVRAFWQNWA